MLAGILYKCSETWLFADMWLHWIQTIQNQCHVSSGGGKAQDLSTVTDPSNSQGIWGGFFQLW